MQRILTALILALIGGSWVFAADAPDAWPHWRGPEFNGVARGDAPLTWSDQDHIAWKVPVPGRGHSSPVIWGDRLFLTTAVPTGNAPAPAPASFQGAYRGGGGPPAEQKLLVLATNTLADQVFIATPAIMDGAIYLRGQNTLFSIRCLALN